MNALKLVTFDVTGTLLKLQPIPAIVFSQNAKDFSINVTADAISPHFKMAWQKVSSEHPNYGCQSGIGWHKWWTLLVKNTFSQAEPTLSMDDQRLDRLANLLINEYKTARCWGLADGAMDILDDIKTANIPIGVISNFDLRLETVLEAMGIRQYFNFVVTSYAARVMKPDKKIFKTAESHVPSAQPSNCLHIGDNFELDYEGALGAGWSAALIDPQAINNNYKAKNNIFSSLKVLQNTLHQKHYKNL